ncbi:MAG: hypothetical protein IJZ85_09350 [Lachnospiraceae bacterium]|nr:hypothetical protein [Lachnospiraceae bacterium]
MGQAETFREDLEALLSLAVASDFRLNKRQVEDVFKNYTLSSDQMEMIYQYLEKNHIIVENDEKTEPTKNRNRQVHSAADSANKKEAGPLDPAQPEASEEDEEDSAYYKMYMADLRGLPPFSKKREAEQLAKYLAGDTSVGQELIEGRLRFAAKTAALYRGQGVLLMDLIQEANMALIMAVSRYEGGSFEELILTEIQSAIEAALEEAGSAEDVGTYLASQVNSLMIVTARLAEELGREATLAELAERMHMPEDSVKELVKIAMDAMTLQEDEQISPELS